MDRKQLRAILESYQIEAHSSPFDKFIVATKKINLILRYYKKLNISITETQRNQLEDALSKLHRDCRRSAAWVNSSIPLSVVWAENLLVGIKI
jgi:hypothetical protein